MNRRLPGIAAVVFSIAALGACGSDSSTSSGPDTTAPPPETLAVRTVAVGASAWGVDVDADRDTVWVSDPARGALVTVGADGRVTGEHATGDTDPRAAGLHVADGRVWVANLGGVVTALDATSGERVAGVAVGPGEPAALLVRDGIVWVPLHGPDGGLARLDATTLQPLEPVALSESGFAIADAADRTIWIAGLDRRVFAIDARTGAMERDIEIGNAPRGIAVGAGSVWVSVRDDREVVRIDPDTGNVQARIALGGRPWPIEFGDGSVWVATLEGRLLQIDPASNEVIAEADAAPEPRTVAVGLGAVWVASQTGTLARVALTG